MVLQNVKEKIIKTKANKYIKNPDLSAKNIAWNGEQLTDNLYDRERERNSKTRWAHKTYFAKVKT